jgi:uncharacterized protein (TIRG00374 family)
VTERPPSRESARPGCEDMNQGMSSSDSDEREGTVSSQQPASTRVSDDGNEVSTAEMEAELAADAEEPSFSFGLRRGVQTGVAVVLLIAAIYFLLPKLVGVRGTLGRLGDADPVWLGVALLMETVAYISYGTLFRGTVGRVIRLTWGETFQITMAGLAASLLFSAGGAGGVVLTYWALRKAGMPARRAACRMVAFMVLLYAVYMAAVLINGILLRAGVFHGPNPAGMTIVPAAIAAFLIGAFLLLALVPGDFERRFSEASGEGLGTRLAHRMATVPATLAMGTRTAISLVKDRSTAFLAIGGAVGWWAAEIGTLWASFHAYGVSVPLSVVVMGYFVGLTANLIPFVPAGVGAVDAGMIGAFVLFGYNGGDVFPAILTYRLFAFWLPIPPGIFAFVRLRRTVARWENGKRPAARRPHVTPEASTAL